MTLKFNPSESYESISPTDSQIPTQARQSQEFWAESEKHPENSGSDSTPDNNFNNSFDNGFDSDFDNGFAKGPTLLIDFDKSPAPEQPVRAGAKGLSRYIHGILQKNQAYIITNLITEESQLLRQPQMVWTIGRNRAAALPLPDRNLSRRHAVLLYIIDDGFYLVDLNSLNGSYVNDQRVQQRQRLRDGDRIRLGATEFSFFFSSQERTVEPIHPEVLARLNSNEARPSPFIDFSELNEEISFNVSKD
jgi:hypothetical protein